MDDSFAYVPIGAAARDRTHTLFAQTMGYVAATAGLFALGAYLGRNLGGIIGIIAYIAAFGCLFGMQFAIRRSVQVTVGLLCAFGVLMGLAVAPTLAYYAAADPQALWQAGGATALFIAGFGAVGYATRRDLTVIARIGFWALVARRTDEGAGLPNQLLDFAAFSAHQQVPAGRLPQRSALIPKA